MTLGQSRIRNIHSPGVVAIEVGLTAISRTSLPVRNEVAHVEHACREHADGCNRNRRIKVGKINSALR